MVCELVGGRRRERSDGAEPKAKIVIFEPRGFEIRTHPTVPTIA
jgi:hypothetical protein